MATMILEILISGIVLLTQQGKSMLTHVFTKTIFVSSAMLLASIAKADDFQLDAPITHVTLFNSGGAIVTRSATITLPRGSHRIVLNGFTADMDEDYGLRTNASAGIAKITYTEVDEQFIEGASYQRQRDLENQIRKLENIQKDDGAKIEAIDLQLGFLRDIGARSGQQAMDGFQSPDDLMTALERSFTFVKNASGDLLAEKSKISATIADRDREIAALRRALKETGDVETSTMKAAIGVEAPSGGSVTLTTTYLVENADWDLSIEANLDTANNQTEVMLFASVEQQTGEDWTDVNLTLSTNRPVMTIQSNMPTPQYLNLRDKVSIREEKQMALASPRFADRNLEEVIVTGSRITGVNTEFDLEFPIEALVSVAGDYSAQRFSLGSVRAPANFVVRANPNYDETAFLYADTVFSDIPAMNVNRVAVSRDGSFVGTGDWPQLLPNELLKLPFGVDDRVTVDVITVPSEDGDTGIFNRREVTEHKKKFVVTNNHDKAYTFEVFDARPNSMNEDLKIEPVRGTTKPTIMDADGQPGIVIWRKELAPGETWEINHWYRTSFPTDKRLVRQ